MYIWKYVITVTLKLTRIFKQGIMDAPVYIDILQRALIPFIKKVYLNNHQFMQDNDPKHVSKLGQKFLSDNKITWWKTPPESSDLNP